MAKYHRESLAACAHAKATAVHGEADCLGEIAIAVGQHRNFAINASGLAPSGSFSLGAENAAKFVKQPLLLPQKALLPTHVRAGR